MISYRLIYAAIMLIYRYETGSVIAWKVSCFYENYFNGNKFFVHYLDR